MRCFHRLLFILCCIGFACTSFLFMPMQAAAAPEKITQAKTAHDTAFIKAELAPPVWSTDPLLITLQPDEILCRKAYKGDWEERCFIAPGMPDQPISGVALRTSSPGTPTVPGSWRWQDSRTLIFAPQNPWPANLAFTADLDALSLPARVRLSSKSLKGSTLPLAGHSAKGEVWIDPSRHGERAVSFALHFTAAPNKSIEKKIDLKAADPSLSFGPMQVTWSQDGTSCLIKAPVTNLSDKDSPVTLHIRDVRLLGQDNGTTTLLPGKLAQSVTVPGKDNLFRISSAELKQQRGARLAPEYLLELKTTLRLSPADVLKALKVVELPAVQNPEATAPYRWTSAPVISDADLAKARPLAVEPVGDPDAPGQPLVLRVPATPGSYVYCSLPKGFGPEGAVLKTPWAAVFQADLPDRAVRFLQPGNVLTLTPGAGDNRLDIFASGVETVQWRAYRIQPDSVNLLHLFTSPYERFTANSNVEYASTVVEGTISLPKAPENDLTPRFATLDMDELMRGGSGLIYIELEGRHNDQLVTTASRLVLATDLGMVAKVMPDGGREVFVCSLNSGLPLKDVTVRILGANGLPVAEAKSDATGKAVLPTVRGLEREKTPVALIASRAGVVHAVAPSTPSNAASASDSIPTQDIAWMALDDSARRVDYSRFATQGQTGSPDNLNAYVFAQRGVFRPGETLHFGMVIRSGDWKTLPPDMPLLATLNDPADRVVLRRPFTVGEGLSELRWDSSETAPTGRYRLDVSTPDSGFILGSGAARVEEFQPDTLSIRAELRQQNAQTAPKGWLMTPTAEAPATLDVFLRNLYGLPAEGRKISAELTSSRPTTLHFAGFDDFSFPETQPETRPDDSPAGAERDVTTTLPQAVADAAGEASLPLPLASFQKRTLFCRVLVEGFEPDGGRAVATEQTFLVSPLPFMIGYRPAGAVGNMQYVPQGTEGGLEFVAVDPHLNTMNPGELTFSVAERRFVTVLSSDSQGKYVYENIPVDKEIAVTTGVANPTDSRIYWTMPTGTAGEFLLTVRDAQKRVITRIPFTVAGNDDLRPALLDNAAYQPSTQLRLRLDKTDYAPGDTIQIFMAAPYAGAGLITLERDRVATHTWFKAPAGNSVHTLTIPEGFEGRGYINVTMGRALTSPEIFVQPHSYAVEPLTVNASGRDMGLRITAAEQVLPGSTIKARLTAKTPGKAVVFAVDEGVLQLTNFSTPDPLRYLLLDRALEVNTDQLFDLLMPVHAQIGKRLPAFGGDMASAGGRFHNPFKRRSEPPMAWWSGVLDVTAENGVEVSIPVPAYTNGQVRLMAVAISADTVGATEARTIVRAPLIISPQLPVMAAPGDAFEGGVALHNTTEKPMTVSLIVADSTLKLEQTLPATVNIPAGKEVLLPLRATAPDLPGEAALQVTATTDTGLQISRSATLSVRPPVLPSEALHMGFAPTGVLPNTQDSRLLYPFMAAGSASVSSAPLPPLRGLLRYLAAYPYDCVEQSISRALPLVLLQRSPVLAARLTPPEILGKPRAEFHTATLENALAAIRAGFRPYRGVAYWGDDDSADILLTAYAGDYLLSLREAGMRIPGDLTTAYFETLQHIMDRSPESLAMARTQAYGLWVLTRSGVITTQSLENLRTQLDERWAGWESDVTATLMAGSYAVMNMAEPAHSLLQASAAGTMRQGTSSGPMNALAARALHVAVLARHFPDQLSTQAGDLSARLLEEMNRPGGYATFSAALGARALLELSATGPVVGLAGAQLVCTDYQPGFEPAPASPSDPASDLPLLTLNAPGCVRYGLTLQKAMPLYWEMSTDGYGRQPPAAPVASGMQVTRTLTRPDGTVLSTTDTVKQGTVVQVALTANVFRATGADLVEIVVADLLPGGFELVLNHPDDRTPTTEGVYTRVDRREDRVIIHTSLDSTPTTSVYHMRAVNRGRYTQPATYAEGLYDRTLRSNTASGMITVE